MCIGLLQQDVAVESSECNSGEVFMHPDKHTGRTIKTCYGVMALCSGFQDNNKEVIYVRKHNRKALQFNHRG